MPNKLVLVQIKSIVNSLTGCDLEKLYNKFSKMSHITRTTKQVGYKCFETMIQLKNITAQGFGRDEPEAQHNAIKNLIDIMLD